MEPKLAPTRLLPPTMPTNRYSHRLVTATIAHIITALMIVVLRKVGRAVLVLTVAITTRETGNDNEEPTVVIAAVAANAATVASRATEVTAAA